MEKPPRGVPSNLTSIKITPTSPHKMNPMIELLINIIDN